MEEHVQVRHHGHSPRATTQDRFRLLAVMDTRQDRSCAVATEFLISVTASCFDPLPQVVVVEKD